MSKISWGKPKILIKDLDVPGANWKEIPTPVEDSTTLEITEGDVLEAKIEGGGKEDEMHKANTANLNLEIRAAKNRHIIVRDKDGVIDHNHAVVVIPQDDKAPGILISRASLHATPSYTCAEGIKRMYKFGALTPDDDSALVKFGEVVLTKQGDVVTNVTIIEEDTEDVQISADPTSLAFDATSTAANTKTVEVSGATAITSARGNRSWLTVTYTGTTVSVTAADNSNTSARQGTVTIVANGESIQIPVTQAGASASE